MIKQLPNTITLLNLLMGCLSIEAALTGDLSLAATYIFIGAIADFLDGFVARMLHAHSSIGKDLDSLADVVTFGVAPGMILFQLSQDYLYIGSDIQNIITWFPLVVALDVFISYLPFLVPIFSAVRLARFNNDTRQHFTFVGLPTPANALLIAAIAFVPENGSEWAATVFLSRPFLVSFPIISSWLMNSNFTFFSLKLKSKNFKDYRWQLFLLLVCLLSLFAFSIIGIAVAIILYILLSIVHSIISKNEV